MNNVFAAKCWNEFFGQHKCFRKYKQISEERDNYCIGWIDPPCNPKDDVYKYTTDAWRFTSSFEVWGVPVSGYYSTYGGGGYIANLAVNRKFSQLAIDELFVNSWVDRKTRAVLLEFTLYCLNTNTFSYNLFMVEFPETGGAFPFYIVYPMKVYQHLGPAGVYTLTCEVLFVVYLLITTVMTIVNILQQRGEYFKQPWQVFDLVFTVLSYVAIAMYIVRTLMTNRSLSLFQQDQKAFINFYHIAVWNASFLALLGCLTFMATLRLLNVFRYSKRVGSFARVFRLAGKDLIWFGFLFTFVFIGFAALGYLLFGASLGSYKSVFSAMSTLFIRLIGTIDFSELITTYPILSKIYFIVFVVYMVYTIFTIFLSMLSGAIDQVHSETKQSNEEEIIEFAIKKVKDLFSFGRKVSARGIRRPSYGK